MKAIHARRSSVVGTIGLLILLLASNAALALTTLNVTLASDNNPGGLGEVGDLRYCLNNMNQSLNTVPDDYAIVFDSAMTIQLNGLLPLINNSSNPVNITIGNPGTGPIVTIDGNSGAYSGLFIPMGNVTIQNMVFQNMTARGGNGGDGISGGGGGMGAGGAIYAPQSFLNGSNPSVTLLNVSTSNTSAIGGNGGSYVGASLTGDEGGGGGGGFAGNGGSITATGSTGGAGGGGFGGNGGDVTVSTDDILGGGGGGGGGLGSRASIGTLTNLGNGGGDQQLGQDGNGYGLAITAGSGGGGKSGGSNAGGAGGGGAALSGGGGGGSAGQNGLIAQGSLPPRPNATIQPAGVTPRGASVLPSGGNGGDGGGGGGGGVVVVSSTNGIDGQAASGGYGGGGGGGAGVGAYDAAYSVRGGAGGLGGGGGGGGVNQSGQTPADGGNSLGGGGGAGGGPSSGANAPGGADIGNLGGGSGGIGSDVFGSGFGGGGGGGGSGLGGAIFVDSNLNFTLQAIPGIPTTFDTANGTVQAGIHGTGGGGGSDGLDGAALGNSIFLRVGAALTLLAQDVGDRLTLGANVQITDDTVLGAGGTSVLVKGDGTIALQGMLDYQGTVTVNNANFRVDGRINQAPVFICRNSNFSQQPGKLSGTGTLTGSVFVNTGSIAPEADATITLGSLTLNGPSVVHTTIDTGGVSVVNVTGSATLDGTLEIALDPAVTAPASYTILTSAGLTGTFAAVTFTAATPADYVVSYLPSGAPTSVQLHILAAQAITNFAATPANPSYAPGGTFTVAASGGASGNPVTFSIAGASASVCSATGATITILTVGTCTVLADQAGNADYTAAPQTVLNVGIGIANQTISNFAATPSNPALVTGGTFTVSATGDASGNPVTFSIVAASASVCSAGGLNGATITMLAAGTCTVQADQAGNASYAAATPVLLNVVLSAVSSTLTLSSAPNPSTQYASVTFTASVTTGAPARNATTHAAGSVRVATGSVSFSDGTTPLGSANLVNGVATFTTTFATVGTHPITANYSGDPATAASSTMINQVVTQVAAVATPALSIGILVLLGALFGGIALARLRAMRTGA